MISKDACPALDINEMFAFLDQYYALWGAVMIVIGLFVNFVGRKSIKPTVFMITFITSTFVLLLILYSLFMQHERENWVNWLILGLCTIAGILLGIFFAYSLKFGIALLGGSAGAFLAFTVCNAFQIENAKIFWTIVACVALIFIVITFRKSDHFMIFTTAMIGSYMFVRGIS